MNNIFKIWGRKNNKKIVPEDTEMISRDAYDAMVNSYEDKIAHLRFDNNKKDAQAIIKLREDLNKTLNGVEERKDLEINRERFLKINKMFAKQIDETLQSMGVEIYRDEHYDLSRQKILKSIKTDDINKDKTIEQSLTDGYLMEGIVIFEQQIYIYRYEGE